MLWTEVCPIPIGPFPPSTLQFRGEYRYWETQVHRGQVAEAVDRLAERHDALTPTEMISLTLGYLYLRGDFTTTFPFGSLF